MSKDTIYREDAIKAIGADIDEIDAFDPSAGIKKACIRRAIWKVMGVSTIDRPQDDEFKNFDRESLILLIEAQKERIGELIADRPQGEWIDAEIPLESGGSMPIQACNLCKTFYPLAYTGGGHRFCPNCGARMKGADDEV